MEKEKFSKRLLQKTVYKVAGVINKLEAINERMTVGLDVLKSLAGRSLSDIISLDKICMKGNVDDIVNGEVEFNVKGNIAGKSIDYFLNAKIEKNLWKVLAYKTLDKTFANATSFGKTIEEIREMLKEAENDKTDLLQNLRETIYRNDINDASKKDVIASEEDFKRYAYAELPRYTLGNDGIVKLFSKESPWALIENNDPLEAAFISNGTRRMIKSKDKQDEEYNQNNGKISRDISLFANAQ